MKIVEREIKGRKGCDKRHDVSCRMPHRASGLTSRAPWPKVKLEAIGKVITGMTPPTKHQAYYGDDYLFVTPSDLGFDSYFISKTERCVSQQGYEKYRNRFIPAMSTMYTCIGSTIGKIGLSRKTVLTNQQINSIIPNDAHDARFVYYLMRSLTNEIRALNAGCAVPIINKGDFENIDVPLVPLPVQRRIVGILSAYDDLIENNRRRIAILEETARLTYRKWFGGAEQSWVAKLGKVSDFFDVSIGRTPPRKNEECFSAESTDLKWLSIKDMRASRVFVLDTTEKLTKAGIEKTHIHVSPPGTIFLSFKLTGGEVVIAGDSMATNEAIAHFETNDRALRDYTYFYLSSFQYDKLGSTSAIARAINSDIVRKMDFVFPARNVLERFGKDVAPMFDQIENLTRQNASLAAARDMLLPRLMKGGVA